MFRDNMSNTQFPPLLNAHLQCPVDTSIAGNMPPQFGPSSFIGNNNGMLFLPRNISNTEAQDIAMQQKLPFFIDNRRCFHGNGEATDGNQNQVFTGLGLSNEDIARNPSLNPPTGNMMNAFTVSSSLSNDIRKELVMQKAELAHYLSVQEQNMARSVKAMAKKHMIGLGKALEKAFAQKLHEKDVELEKLAQKNKQLYESVREQTAEAQNWISIAKHNESLINHLKSDLQKAIQAYSEQTKEGFAENDPDLATGPGDDSQRKSDLVCRSCKVAMASVLLMPCRHLCLCKECDGFVNVCPVCQMMKSFSFEVYLS